ncbi:MAG TPA: ASPIC/UnbV domain-containing protein [Candidatus Acidoferrum sp.]|nr:ASPIC/UnbV domain-containing protein [Candidatus Acidoferrum sp.]
MAYVDYDGDGAVDVIVVNHRQPSTILHNNIGSRNHWLTVDLQGTKSNRQGVGARLTYRIGNVKRIRETRSGGGFNSSSSVGPTLGLGQATQVDELTIRWPSGMIQTLHNIPANRRIKVVEKAGETAW